MPPGFCPPCPPTWVIYTVGPLSPGPEFTYPFDLEIDAATVLVTVQFPNTEIWLKLTQDSSYFIIEGGGAISFDQPGGDNTPPTGTKIRIERCTDASRILDYQAGSTLTSANLNFENIQQFYLIQELCAIFGSGGTSPDDPPSGCVLTGDPTCTYWEAQNKQGKHAAAATDPNDWVILSQLTGVVPGPSTAKCYTFLGDGIKTDFELVDSEGLATEIVFVSIDGVLQHACTTGQYTPYTVIDPSDPAHPGGAFEFSIIRFLTPPALNTEVEVRALEFIANPSFQDGTLSGSVLIDCSVTPDKICGAEYAAGLGQKQRIVWDDNGDYSFVNDSVITPFETALNTWLATKRLGDLLNDTSPPGSRFGNETLFMANGGIIDFQTGGSVRGIATPTDANVAYAVNVQYVLDKIAAFAAPDIAFNFAFRADPPDIDTGTSNSWNSSTITFNPEYVTVTADVELQSDPGTAIGGHTWTAVFGASNTRTMSGAVAHLNGAGWSPAVLPPVIISKSASGPNYVLNVAAGEAVTDITGAAGIANITLTNVTVTAWRRSP